MAIAKLNPMYEYVSGATAKPVKKNGHNHGHYVVNTHRKAATTSPFCTRVYTPDSDRYTRTTPPSVKEINIRNRFSAVSAMVIARREDLTKVTTDQAAFLAQKDLANGKKTMRAYLWYVCGQEYDAQNG